MTTLDDSTQQIPDPSTVSMKPTAMRYGLIGGLALVVLSLIWNMTGMIDYTGEKSNMLPNIVNWGTIAAVLVLAFKKHRDEDLGGFIKFGRCVGLGAFLGLVMGIISAVWALLYFNIIDPDLMNNILSQLEEKFVDQGMEESQIEMAMSWTSKMMSPVGMAIMAVIGAVFTTTILSLIVGAVMKKNPPSSI
jgi:Protein of unknown function (DUF4199)